MKQQLFTYDKLFCLLPPFSPLIVADEEGVVVKVDAPIPALMHFSNTAQRR